MKTYYFKTQYEAIEHLQRLARRLGKTPSEKVFYKNSGTKLYPLQKLGFLTYGHLVNKAKLTPNKFDNTKYSNEFLIGEFIKIIKRDKKWPTKAELDVKHLNDPSFPTSATFYKKFGLRNGIANAVLDEIGNKKGLDDVIEICNQVLNTNNSASQDAKKDDSDGSVYIYKNGKRPEYKIGVSASPLDRGIQLSTLSPEDLRLVYKIKTPSPRAVERYLHDKFRDKRIRGEWFSLSPSEIRWIKDWDGNIFSS